MNILFRSTGRSNFGHVQGHLKSVPPCSAFDQPKLLVLQSLLQARFSSAVGPQLQKDYLTTFWEHEMIDTGTIGMDIVPFQSLSSLLASGTGKLRSGRLPEPMSNQDRVEGGEVDGSEKGPSTT